MIKETKAEKALRNMEVKLEHYELVICDEIG